VSRARDLCAAKRTLDTAPTFQRMSLESEGKKTLKAARVHRAFSAVAPIARSPLSRPSRVLLCRVHRALSAVAPIARSLLVAFIARSLLLAFIARPLPLASIASHEPHASK
jgi:hypothetical protein